MLANEASSARVAKRKKKILVLDHEPHVIALINKTLTAGGYSVTTATSGEAGFDLIRQETFDLIIVDLLMPDLSGFAFLDILHAMGCNMPVLVISSITGMAADLAHQGIAGLLIKPIDPERLLIHIGAIFRLEEASEGLEASVAEARGGEGRSVEGLPPLEPAASSQEIHAPAGIKATVPQGEVGVVRARPLPKKKPLVLVIEDEPDMQKLLADMLNYQGFDVAVARDGEAGLALAHEKLPNAIILDIMLPRMDGFQICRLIKFDDKYRDIPIVILTARTLQEDRDLAKAAGADAFFTKPFDTKDFLKVLQELIIQAGKAQDNLKS